MNPIVSPDIEAYAAAHSTGESDVCRMIREETYRTQESPHMVVGPLEGAFLKFMVRAIRARRVMEVGTFTGYSALAMAEALPADGTVITCEIDPDSASMAHTFWDRSPHGKKITVRLGPALETMKSLTDRFDLIFIDADKGNYLNYYRRALELLEPTGVILIDNVLWNGDVLKNPPPDATAVVIQELNRTIAADHHVMAVLLPLRDGVFVITKK